MVSSHQKDACVCVRACVRACVCACACVRACRPAVRFRGEFRVFPGRRLRVPGSSAIQLHHRRGVSVHLWLRNGVQCRHPLLGLAAAAQLHLQSVLPSARH